jgi:hypothetical protein
MVAVLGGGRAIARAVGRRSGFSLGRPRHCPVWRSSRPRCERRPPGRRPRRSGRGPLSAGVSDCLDAGWAWHGRGSLRSGFCDARSPLWTGRTLGNNNAHAVWRFCEHRMLASFRLPRCASWLARRMPCLCRLPDCRCVAGLFVRIAARISAARASASLAEFANARAQIPQSSRKHFSPAGRDHHAEFGDLDNDVGSFADGAASQGAYPRCRRASARSSDRLR